MPDSRAASSGSPVTSTFCMKILSLNNSAILLLAILSLLNTSCSSFTGAHVATVHKIPHFNGRASILSESDKRAISKIAESIPARKKPIVWIEVRSKNEVHVYTGEIHGPVSGGGPIFVLKRCWGIWLYVDDGNVSYWVS